jgi:hypothetical protein
LFCPGNAMTDGPVGGATVQPPSPNASTAAVVINNALEWLMVISSSEAQALAQHLTPNQHCLVQPLTCRIAERLNPVRQENKAERNPAGKLEGRNGTMLSLVPRGLSLATAYRSVAG